jgi:hypothetical protein
MHNIHEIMAQQISWLKLCHSASIRKLIINLRRRKISKKLRNKLISDHVDEMSFVQTTIFGRLINQTKGDRCDIYLVGDLHIFYYQKRKGLDRSMANESVSGASIG